MNSGGGGGGNQQHHRRPSQQQQQIYAGGQRRPSPTRNAPPGGGQQQHYQQRPSLGGGGGGAPRPGGPRQQQQQRPTGGNPPMGRQMSPERRQFGMRQQMQPPHGQSVGAGGADASSSSSAAARPVNRPSMYTHTPNYRERSPQRYQPQQPQQQPFNQDQRRPRMMMDRQASPQRQQSSSQWRRDVPPSRPQMLSSYQRPSGVGGGGGGWPRVGPPAGRLSGTPPPQSATLEEGESRSDANVRRTSATADVRGEDGGDGKRRMERATSTDEQPTTTLSAPPPPLQQDQDEADETAPIISKDDIMTKMDKLDDDISKYEAMLDAARKSKSEAPPSSTIQPPSALPSHLQVDTTKPATPSLPPSEPSPILKPKPGQKSVDKDEASMIARIYRENRSRIKRATNREFLLPVPLTPEPSAKDDIVLAAIGSPSMSSVPQPKEPSSYPFYQQNLDYFHGTLKHRLVKYLSQRQQEIREKEEELRAQYQSMYEEWQEKIIAYEEKERLKMLKDAPVKSTRTGTESATDMGMNQYDYDPEHDFRYLKTLAVIPSMILDERDREQVRYLDNNTKFDDTIHAIRMRNNENPWTDEEKRVFTAKYLEYPKEFGRIAAYLPNKSASDCVLFYYLNKKSLKLKSLTRQAIALRNKRRRKTTPEAMYGDDYDRYPRDMSQEPLEGSGYDAGGNDPYATAEERYMPEYTANMETEWSEEEVALAKPAFLEYGMDFLKVSARVTTKTAFECRKFHQEFMKEYGVDLTNADEMALLEDDPLDGNGAVDVTPPDTSMESIPAAKEEPVDDDAKVMAVDATVHNLSEQEDVPATKAESVPPPPLVTMGDDVGAPPAMGKKKPGPKRARARAPSAFFTGTPDTTTLSVSAPAATFALVQEGAAAQQPAPAPAADTKDGKDKEKRRTVSYWTAKEKAEFLRLYPLFGKDWKGMADVLQTKSEIQIRNYFQNNKLALGLPDIEKASGGLAGTQDPLSTLAAAADVALQSNTAKAALQQQVEQKQQQQQQRQQQQQQLRPAAPTMFMYYSAEGPARILPQLSMPANGVKSMFSAGPAAPLPRPAPLPAVVLAPLPVPSMIPVSVPVTSGNSKADGGSAVAVRPLYAPIQPQPPAAAPLPTAQPLLRPANELKPAILPSQVTAQSLQHQAILPAPPKLPTLMPYPSTTTPTIPPPVELSKVRTESRKGGKRGGAKTTKTAESSSSEVVKEKVDSGEEHAEASEPVDASKPANQQQPTPPTDDPAPPAAAATPTTEVTQSKLIEEEAPVAATVQDEPPKSAESTKSSGSTGTKRSARAKPPKKK